MDIEAAKITTRPSSTTLERPTCKTINPLGGFFDCGKKAVFVRFLILRFAITNNNVLFSVYARETLLRICLNV